MVLKCTACHPMPNSRSNSVEREIGLAASAVRAGDSGEALTHLKTALLTEPDNELALGMSASIYAELGMDDRACDTFRKVLTINPANALAQFQLGLIEFRRGALTQALEIWQTPEPASNDFMLRFYSGLALAQLGRSEEAHALFIEASKHVPNDHPIRPELQSLLSA